MMQSNSDAIMRALDAMNQKLAKLDTIDEVQATVTRLEQQQQDQQAAIQRLENRELDRGRGPPPQGVHGDRPPKLHRIDFPKFDGKADPLLFINKCESFFHQQRILAEEQVWLASFHLEGPAQQWYIRVQREEGTPPWRRFTELLNLRFGPPLRSCPLGKLAACRRTGSVADYSERFLDLLAHAGPLTEPQQVQLFTKGLQEPLSIDV
ncbi:hypothetical protein U9M48_008358 [Paspalum notatum var. saurae]|uniref:Retrotransposon gag domain-containing protein n=1 Tax=Paspalum notatum var. saurae TaxID=547442 RepID=A0AAQ3WDH8_PASNO